MKIRKNSHGRTGFTLIELLVVVAIIVVLIAILLPSLGRARRQAQEVACGSNLKQVGNALYQYSSDYDGWTPMAFLTWDALQDSGYLETVFQYIDNTYPDGAGWLSDPVTGTRTLVGVDKGKLILKCPSLVRDTTGWSPTPGNPRNFNYTVNARTFGDASYGFPYQRKLASIGNQGARLWVADAPPADVCYVTFDNGNMMISFNRHRDSGANVLYVDGHVGFINPYYDLKWSTRPGNPANWWETDLDFYGNNDD